LYVADLILDTLSTKHPYFGLLSSSMQIWARLFGDSNITFKSSRRHESPPVRSSSIDEFKDWAVTNFSSSRRKDLAVFMIVRNEAVFLPIWLRYYSSQVDAQDIYILDNDSTDGSTRKVRYHVVRVQNHLYFDHVWLIQQVKDFSSILLQQMGYKYVLFAEVDEMVVPDPHKYSGGLMQYAEQATAPDIRCTGYNVCHNNVADSAPIDLTVPVMKQRKQWYRTDLYDKPLLTNHVLDYQVGFHVASDMQHVVDPSLYLVHLHYFDYNFCVLRHKWKHQQNFKQDDTHRGWGIGAQSIEKSLKDCSCKDGHTLEDIPVSLREPNFAF
jgi:hypothetical protein